MNYSGKDDWDLQNQYDKNYREGNREEVTKIEREFNYRGYEDNGFGHFQKKDESDGYSSDSGSSGSGGFLFGFNPGFLVLLVIFGFMAVYAFGILPYAVVKMFFVKLYTELFPDLRQYYPLNDSYSKDMMLGKIKLTYGLIKPFTFFTSVFLTISLISFRAIKIRHLTRPVATFIALSSFYLMFQEYQKGEATVFSGIIYVLTFVICVLPIKKLKKNFLIGLYVSVISTLGFIVAGNSLLSPFLALNMSSIILIFSRGSYFFIKEKTKATKTVDSEAA